MAWAGSCASGDSDFGRLSKHSFWLPINISDFDEVKGLKIVNKTLAGQEETSRIKNHQCLSHTECILKPPDLMVQPNHNLTLSLGFYGECHTNWLGVDFFARFFVKTVASCKMLSHVFQTKVPVPI